MKKLKKITSKMIEVNKSVYDEYQRIQMNDGWYDGNKLENFSIMAKITELSGKKFKNSTCLDVGCGTGDLYKFLKRRGISSYVGIDIYPPAIYEAKKKYPKATFMIGDIIAGDLAKIKHQKSWDFGFCSGAVTTNFKLINNYDYLYSLIKSIWDNTKVGIVFNFLTNEYDGYDDPDLFCYDTEKVLPICVEIAPFASLLAEPTPGKSQMHIFMWR